MRMLISIKNIKTGRLDTLYDNLNNELNIPTKLLFNKIVEDKYFVMILESDGAYIHRYYEWNDNAWKFVRDKVVSWKSKEFTSKINIIEYDKLEVTDREGDYLWKFDLPNKKFEKEDVKIKH